MTWILILSMYAKWGYSGGPVVSSVAGFQSREVCLAAGNEWLKQARHTYADYEGVSMAALCVPSR